MAKLKKFSLMLTEDMHALIQSNAEARGLTMNAVVITALENHFLQHNAVDAMQQLLQQMELAEQQQSLENKGDK